MSEAFSQLRLRTEYNLGRAYGQIDKVLSALPAGTTTAAITDIGTWGHVNFYKECKAKNIKPIFGTEIAVVENCKERIKQPANYMAFLARNNDGLKELYELVTHSTAMSYYFPRIDYDVVQMLSSNVAILSGTAPILDRLPKMSNLFFEASFMTPANYIRWAIEAGYKVVATGDNYYPKASDKPVYDILLGKDRDNRTYPMFITGRSLLQSNNRMMFDSFFANADALAAECYAELPQAKMVKFKSDQTLEQICRAAAKQRKVDLSNPIYEQRLQRELKLIAEKQFEDYFYVLWDLLAYAKQHMLVGPARGSSCGSLVCYLLAITEIDPIPYDLLFERFIDVTRKDLPDIDIDFADDRRDLVFKYLKDKYGEGCVARLGTILRFKAKSAISQTAKFAIVPEWEVDDLKDSIIERSGGDSRAKFCIIDTFEQLEIGQEVLKKYPQMRYAGELEQHAHHSGQHAAGIVVTDEPVDSYCSLDKRNGALQIDKIDAEALNLLKIDALGLRTLSILQDSLDQIRQTRQWLYELPTNDQAAFDVLNQNKFAGVFQYEGFALQSLTKQMKIREFEDIVAITALARPGPLSSGAATTFVDRRIGKQEVFPIHQSCEDITKVTYGTVIYQEQVMRIAREVGKLSWEDTSSLRKAMSKSLGQEFFDKYWERFKVGAKENGIDEKSARYIWDHINTMGAWSFNRSHAVAYGLLSYWCCYIKAHYPLEFAAANLRNTKDDDQAIRLLRELHKEGIGYVAFDKDKSEINWSIKDGKLIGGYVGIKGCGMAKAAAMIRKRENNLPYAPGEMKMLANPVTPYDDIFECNTRFGHIRREPEKYKIITPIKNIEDINSDEEQTVVFFGRIKEKNLRDMNEAQNLAKRGGKKVNDNQYWLNFNVEDDTGSIMCTIGRFQYEKLGRPIVEFMKEGHDWLLIKAKINKGYRIAKVEQYRHLNPKAAGAHNANDRK